MAKKNTIRLSESQLRKMISESVRNILKEVQVHYGTHNDSYTKTDSYWDSNDNGHSYEYSNEYTNEIKEDYIELARRLEKLTGCEWHVQRHENEGLTSTFRYGDYADEYHADEGIEFVCPIQKFGGTRKEDAAIKDKALKMVELFFGDKADVFDIDNVKGYNIIVGFTNDGKDWRTRNINTDTSHPHSKKLTLGKKYVGYKKGEGKKIKGYTNPYPNNTNGRGAQEEEDWFNSVEGNPWFNADRNNHSVRDAINRWRDPDFLDAHDSGYFDEY